MPIKLDTLSNIFNAPANEGAALTILDKRDNATTLSFSELHQRAEEGAAALVERGCGPGTRVALVARSTFAFVTGCLSVWRAGAAVVPMPFPPRFIPGDLWDEQINARLRVARPGLFLTDEEDRSSALEVQTLPLSGLKSSGSAGPGAAVDDAAVVQFTSGSTSQPRGIVISHRAMSLQLEALFERFGKVPSPERIFSWLPLYHDLGMVTCLIRALAFGEPLTLLPTDLFLAQPVRWLLGVSRDRATTTAAPNFAFGLAARQIERGLPEPIDLSSLRFVPCGGEAADPRTLDRFLRVAEPLGFDPGALLPGYGLAESTCVVTVPPEGHGCVLDHVSRQRVSQGVAEPAPEGDEGSAAFASVGFPLSGTELRIVDQHGATLSDRGVGAVQTRGPSLMDGYFDDPEGTAAAFTDGGWLRTGDLGYMVHGELYITGRAKDMIIVRGQNFYAEDIERVAQSVDGVRPGGCVAISVDSGATEKLVVAAETKQTEPAELDRLRAELVKRIWAATGLSPKEILLLPPGMVPKTTSGKLQRNVARELYLNGTVQKVALLESTHRE